MTRGYYVLEKGNKILEAAYLSGDAYLCEGYGEKIIRAFSEKTIKVLYVVTKPTVFKPFSDPPLPEKLLSHGIFFNMLDLF